MSTWTPTEKAFERWSIHVVTCRVCQVDDSRCERGQRLGDLWWQSGRQPCLLIGSR